jgi:hypothetical protein
VIGGPSGFVVQDGGFLGGVLILFIGFVSGIRVGGAHGDGKFVLGNIL